MSGLVIFVADNDRRGKLSPSLSQKESEKSSPLLALSVSLALLTESSESIRRSGCSRFCSSFSATI